MKKTYFLILFMAFTYSISFGQSEDYLDIIATKTCECVELKKSSEAEEQLSPKMQVGVCLFESAKDYKKQLAKQYNLNLDDLAGDAEKLGELIGNRMAFICPNTLLKFSMDMEDEKEELMIFYSNGEITDIKEDLFVVFNVKNEEGKNEKFYWLTFLTSEFDVQSSFEELKGKKVKIQYFEEELFDPRIREYRVFNNISSLELAE